MKLLQFTLCVVFPLLVLGSDEVVLKEGSVLEAGESVLTGNGCRLSLQDDGNLIARRPGPIWNEPGFSDRKAEIKSWKSGAHESNGEYYAILQDDGNLQVIRSPEEVVYTTHVFPPTSSSANHKLIFTDKCTLRITRIEDGSTTTEWTNIHESFDNFSRQNMVIGRGEFYTYPTMNYGSVCKWSMDCKPADFCLDVPFSLLLHNDCNLVVFVGHDLGDKTRVVWSPDVPRPNAMDCYLLIDSNDVALYEGSFDPTLPLDSARPGKYWSVPPSFFDVQEYVPGKANYYQVVIDNDGELYLDWD